MGRHDVASTPMRSPAVLIGAPVATVLATMGSNAVLGGVVPTAEEVPLSAEAPGSGTTAPGVAAPATQGAGGGVGDAATEVDLSSPSGGSDGAVPATKVDETDRPATSGGARAERIIDIPDEPRTAPPARERAQPSVRTVAAKPSRAPSTPDSARTPTTMTFGSEAVGADESERAESDRVGSDGAASDGADESDRAGSDGAGSDRAGSDRAGSDRAGETDRLGPDVADDASTSTDVDDDVSMLRLSAPVGSVSLLSFGA